MRLLSRTGPLINNMSSSTTETIITWNTGAFNLCITLDEGGAPCVEYVKIHGTAPSKPVSPYFSTAKMPLNGIRVAGQGQGLYKTAKSLVGSVLSGRLQYVNHVEREDATSKLLDIVSEDYITGLEVTHHFQVFEGTFVLRSWAEVKNISNTTQTLNQVTSLTIGGLTAGTTDWCHDYTLLTANNSWFRELQWQERSLPDLGIDEIRLHVLEQGHKATMAKFSLSTRGSLTTETHFPMGALRNKNINDTWLWQIEPSGSWRWEIGDWQDGLYLAAGGPTLADHAWQMDLAPGETFTSVPVAICHMDSDLDSAFAAMNQYRRHIIRPHSDYTRLPIIFNDYMNCLMGDPNEEKIKALLKPVQKCGAEYYVIDAGWYADDGDWWDDVGMWEPSSKRFPTGFKALLDTIRSSGLIPGVWLEPEVIGVQSLAAALLPDDAFFQDRGRRVEERCRFQLDFTHSAVRERLHGIIARLVREYGVGYFKFDYNIDVITGSDVHTGLSTGAAHLAHHNAYRAWVDEVLSAHPGLVIENCSSGGQRMEYGMLSVHTLQSTSDQQDPFLYASIAAAAPTAVIPEQSASWAYPQREWDNEKNAFTVVNSLLGRVHLSGRLDALNPQQLELVRDGMKVYCRIRQQLLLAQPFWPLGLPTWNDDWVSLGMLTADGSVLLAVWRRAGATSCKLPLRDKSHLQQAEVLYPASFETQLQVVDGVLDIRLPEIPCARLLHIKAV